MHAVGSVIVNDECVSGGKVDGGRAEGRRPHTHAPLLLLLGGVRRRGGTPLPPEDEVLQLRGVPGVVCRPVVGVVAQLRGGGRRGGGGLPRQAFDHGVQVAVAFVVVGAVVLGRERN